MNMFSVRLLLFLFLFNSIAFAIYLLFSHSLTENNHPVIDQPLTKYDYTPPQSPFPLKPWPILPSYLPWIHKRSTQPRYKSCESYFGNGFSRRIDLIHPSKGPGRSKSGWFHCFYSETLRSSICEGGPVRMIPNRIQMSAGGEKLESVIGREEREELPLFKPGAFEMELQEGGNIGRRVATDDFLDEFVPRGGIDFHTMRGLLSSMQFVDSKEFHCTEWVEDTTILVTRFEYANLFHTITDWYSAYVSSRVTGLAARPHVVFVDGHCKAQLEEVWEAMFSSVRYAKNFTGSVCFRHVILSPLGYETSMFKGLSESIDCHGVPAHELKEKPDNQKTARLLEFGEMLRASFNLPVEDRNLPKHRSGSHDVLFVRREDYLAHPRHNGRVQSRLSNEQEVFDAIKIWAKDYSRCKLNLVNGLFAHMSMEEQIRAIKDASVIIGAHGAGLTHIVAANSGAVVLEIISSLYRRPHFALISQWRGLRYRAINLSGSYAKPEEVIHELSSILQQYFGC